MNLQPSVRPEPGKIRVDHEFGTLREVIVGRPEGLRLPVLTESMSEEIKDLVRLTPEFQRKGSGQLLVDFAPAMAARLAEQVDALAALLQERGIVVHRPRLLTDAEQLYPGVGEPGGTLIFMRDPIVVIGDKIIELAMMYPFRRRQKFALREIVASRAASGGGQLLAMPEPMPVPHAAGWGAGPFLEGGDILLNGKHVYVGHSGHASSVCGADWLQQLLGASYAVETVSIRKGFIHLDCVLSLPRPGLAIACLEALPEGLPASIASWDIIEVSMDEARRLGCNGLILDEKTYVLDAVHARVADKLREHGTEVIAIPYDAPAMFGGGLRCSHHPLRRLTAHPSG